MNDISNKTPLTVEAAADWSGYSRPYLYKLIHEGKIPYYKPDNSRHGKIFICKEELAAFIFGNRIATKKEIAESANNLEVER